MTKILKKRFIIFTMTAVTCLLVFIVLTINGLNWMMLDRQSDMIMKMLVSSDGAFHKWFLIDAPFSRPLDMDRMRSSRFFIVRSDLDGNIRDINTDQIFSIDIETAKSYASTVSKTGRESGRIKGYKYFVKEIGPESLTFFLDTSEQNDSFNIVHSFQLRLQDLLVNPSGHCYFALLFVLFFS